MTRKEMHASSRSNALAERVLPVTSIVELVHSLVDQEPVFLSQKHLSAKTLFFSPIFLPQEPIFLRAKTLSQKHISLSDLHIVHQ